MERRNINMITTNEKQTTQQQEFITDLITCLTRVNDEMMLSFVADLVENSKDRFPSIYWNCLRMELTTEAVVGETYYLFSIELKEMYRLGGTVTEYHFSLFKEYFKVILTQLKEDLIDENRDERFIFGQRNNIYVEDDSYLQGDFPLEILNENQLKMFFFYVFTNNKTLFSLIEENGKVVKELSHYQQYVDEAIGVLRQRGVSYFLDDVDNFKGLFKQPVVDVISNYSESFQTKFYNKFLNELLTRLQNTNKKFSKNDLETFISDLSKLSKVCEHFNSETISEIIKIVVDQGLPQLSVVGISNLLLMIENFDLNVCDFIQQKEIETFVNYYELQDFMNNEEGSEEDLCDYIFNIQDVTSPNLNIKLEKVETENFINFFDDVFVFLISLSQRGAFPQVSDKLKFVLDKELLPHLKLLQENPQLLVSKVCSEEDVKKVFDLFAKI